MHFTFWGMDELSSVKVILFLLHEAILQVWKGLLKMIARKLMVYVCISNEIHERNWENTSKQNIFAQRHPKDSINCTLNPNRIQRSIWRLEADLK